MDNYQSKLRVMVLPGYNDERGQSLHKHLQEVRQSNENFLIGVSAKNFGDGESTMIYNLEDESIRGTHAVYIEDITKPMEHGLRVPNERFAQLKSAMGGRIGKEGNEKRCTVVTPFQLKGRQDKSGQRGSLDMAQSIKELASLGATNIITVDAHNPTASENAAYMADIGFVNMLPTVSMLIAILEKEYKAFRDGQLMTVSPDEGATARNAALASMLASPRGMGLFFKERDFTQIVDGAHPIKQHIYTGPSVKDTTVILDDDIIASGDTLLGAARILKDKGAERVILKATHPLFTKGLENFDKAVKNEIIDHVFVTNSVYVPPEFERDWLTVVDITKYIANTINALHENRSLSEYVRRSPELAQFLTTIRSPEFSDFLQKINGTNLSSVLRDEGKTFPELLHEMGDNN